MSEQPSLEIVDISKDDMQTAQALVRAASTLGFVFIEGSGFSQKDVDEAFQLSEDFFKQPLEVKKEVMIDEGNHGYSSMNLEILDPENQTKGDPKEAFNIAQDNNGGLSLPLPSYLEQHQAQVDGLWTKCHAVGERLLHLLAKGLEIDAAQGGDAWLSSRHKVTEKSGSVLRFLHYPTPATQDPETAIRAGAHTDYGTLTLLFQTAPGLEILSPVTKKWTPVQYIRSKTPGAAAPLVVNIADLLSFWTSGVLKSSIHRVKFPSEANADRYSIVYFLHPQNTVPLEPIPSEIVKAAGATRGSNAQKDGKYMTAHEHLEKRLAATYGWKS